MEHKRVEVGSKVTVEIYLTKRVKKGGRFVIEYERYLQHWLLPCHDKNWTYTYIICDDPEILKNSNGHHLHPGSFSGRALMGRMVGDEVKVNVGGLELSDSRIGSLSGNHLKYKIVAIE